MQRSLCAIAIWMVVPLLTGAQAHGAVLTGRVLTDTTRLPLSNAEVSLPELGLRGVTNEKGEFRLTNIIPGKHRVLVRRLGYGLVDSPLEFAADETIESTVYLTRVTLLDTVSVAGKPNDPWMAEFEANRHHGAGHYLTREQLAKMEGRSLGSVMSQTPGMSIMNGSGGQAWATTKHPPTTQCGARDTVCIRRERLFYLPVKYELYQGMKRACYARVYVDRMLMNPGQPADPFDLNTIPPMEIEAIEWYASMAEAPSKYANRTAACGIMVIHTRRSP